MTQELQDKLDKKEVVLGWCCIAIPSPTHHRNSCGKDFGGNYFTKPAFVRELYFYVGGYFGTSHWIYLHEQKYGKILRYVASDSHYIDIKSELADCGLNLIKIYLDVISLTGKAAILTRMYWMEPNGSLMLHLITVQQLSVMAVMPIHPIGKNWLRRFINTDCL